LTLQYKLLNSAAFGCVLSRTVIVSVLEYTDLQFTSVQFDTLFNTRFSEVAGLLEEVGFQSTPKLSFGDGGRAQMARKTVPDDRSGNAETSFAEFRGYSRYGRISTFHRTETGSAREIRRRYVTSVCYMLYVTASPVTTVQPSGNGVLHLNEVALRRARLVLRRVTVRTYILYWYVTSHPANSASLAGWEISTVLGE